MSTLLEKALAISSARKESARITNEHIELALAWTEDKVSLTQVSQALELKHSKGGSNVQAYVVLARALKEHHLRTNGNGAKR